MSQTNFQKEPFMYEFLAIMLVLFRWLFTFAGMLAITKIFFPFWVEPSHHGLAVFLTELVLSALLASYNPCKR